MDKRKIGQFISECRRKKHITQGQLAEMLEVTDKSVSKWENGHSLPDATLYEPLCSILGISINEFFAGQKTKEEDCKSIADINLSQMIKYRLYNLSDKRISFSEFDSALIEIAELTEELKRFRTKEEAVQYLMKETNFSYEECANAYDFYVNLFAVNEPKRDAK